MKRVNNTHPVPEEGGILVWFAVGQSAEETQFIVPCLDLYIYNMHMYIIEWYRETKEVSLLMWASRCYPVVLCQTLKWGGGTLVEDYVCPNFLLKLAIKWIFFVTLRNKCVTSSALGASYGYSWGVSCRVACSHVILLGLRNGQIFSYATQLFLVLLMENQKGNDLAKLIDKLSSSFVCPRNIRTLNYEYCWCGAAKQRDMKRRISSCRIGTCAAATCNLFVPVTSFPDPYLADM